MYNGDVAKRVSIAAARANLSTLVDEVAAGEQVELTRHGKPVAIVVSVAELERIRTGRQGFGPAFRRFLEEQRPGDLDLADAYTHVDRERGPGRPVDL